MTWEIVPEPERASRDGRARSPWWMLLLTGVLVAAAGIGLLIWPFIAASWILVILFGSALTANGLAVLVRQRGSGASAAGVVLILVGILAIVFSGFTAQVLVIFVGVSLIAVGAFWLVLAARLSGRGIGVSALPAALVVLAGVFALVWPSVALSVVAVIGGLCTLILGSSLIAAALALRRALG